MFESVSYLDGIILLINWALIFWHAWALKYHFNMPVAFLGVRIISLMVAMSGLALSFLVVKIQQPVLPQVIAAFASLYSVWLFWRTMKESRQARLLAAFDEKLPHCLISTGPYRYVRHPFYSSYLLQWAAWSLASWSLWSWIPFLSMFTLYTVAARDEEAKFLLTEMSNDYQTFMKTRGRFFPSLFSRQEPASLSTKNKKTS